MPRETLAQLHARITELEARNEELAAAVAARPPAPPAPPVSTPPAAPHARGATIGRSIIAGVLVVLGLLVTPFALIVSFAQAQVTDTETFVAAYAPLAESPEVQEAITDAVVYAVNENVDLALLTGGIIDGLQQLELPGFVSNGLDLLRQPLVDGVNALIRWGVTSVVTSEWFPTVWEQTLRLTHSQLIAVLRGDPNAIAQISGDTVSLQLGPVVTALRDQLVTSGVGIAQLIPSDLDVTIPVADVQGIGNAKTFYAVAVASGFWLPVIAAALLVGGIAVAPRRRGWVLGTSVALGVIAIAFAIGLSIGGSAVVAASPLSPDALGVIFGAATGALAVTLAAVIGVAVVGAVVAWLLGPSRPALAARAALDRGPALARERLALTNPVSRALERYRPAALWLIAAAAVVTIVFFRPLTLVVVLVTVLIALVLVVAVEVFRSGRRAAEPAAEDVVVY